MRVLVIEDEPIAARLLVRQLAHCAPDVRVCATVGSVQAALRWLDAHPSPDALFLDVHLSDGLGLDLLDALPYRLPTVFTTAYENYAVRAFERDGVDYLLKPIDPARLREAVDRLRQRRSLHHPKSGVEAGDHHRDGEPFRSRFLVKHKGAWMAVGIDEVACFVRAPAVKLVSVHGQSHFVSFTLEALAGMLDPRMFFRINRQLLAHRQAIQRIVPLFKGRMQVELRPVLPDALCRVSQPRGARLKTWLGH